MLAGRHILGGAGSRPLSRRRFGFVRALFPVPFGGGPRRAAAKPLLATRSAIQQMRAAQLLSQRDTALLALRGPVATRADLRLLSGNP